MNESLDSVHEQDTDSLDERYSPSSPISTRSEENREPASRPNKYRGPASTWRNWTAPERDLVTSLERLKAKDLSVHLYNAFKLKHGIQDIRGQKLDLDSDPSTKEVTWTPPKVWTAWPLPPDLVPREEDEKTWEDVDSVSEFEDVQVTNTSRNLRDLLVAQVLRKAKEGFGRRGFANEDGVLGGKNLAFMADDDRATQILRSTTQHLLTKLDKLLMDLHHIRSAHLPINDDTDESERESPKKKASLSKTRNLKRRRNTSTERSDLSMDDGSEVTADTPIARSCSRHSGSYSRNSSRTFDRRKRRLNLRDWSEVLGTASLSGWEFSIIEKATARCSALFGETMTFRTIREADARNYADESHESDESLIGGVHRDGFLKPIEGKKSWKYDREGKKRQRLPFGKRRPIPS